MTLVIVNIKWDTEGETLQECNLPETVIVTDVLSGVENEGWYRERLSVALSDSFGFNHHGFELRPWRFDMATHGDAFFPSNLAMIPSP